MASHLTGNDIALAQAACALAIAWHKAQPTSDFGRNEIAKLTALSKKFNDLLDWAYQAGEPDEIEGGNEVVMRPAQDCYGLPEHI